MTKILYIIFLWTAPTVLYGQEKFTYKHFSDSTFKVGDKIIAPTVNYSLSGGMTILDESKDSVNVIATFLTKHSTFKIEIGGHTDSRGKAESNIKVTEYKTQRIKDYLTSIKNIAPERIKTMGYGKSALLISDKIIYSTKTLEEAEKLHSVNRRTEIKILSTD